MVYVDIVHLLRISFLGFSRACSRSFIVAYMLSMVPDDVRMYVLNIESFAITREYGSQVSVRNGFAACCTFMWIVNMLSLIGGCSWY